MIYIRDLTGNIVIIPANDDDTIDTIKARIEDQAGVPRHAQRLIFVGRQLEDGRTLRDYRISDGSILHLVLCLKGGGSNMLEDDPKHDCQTITHSGALDQALKASDDVIEVLHSPPQDSSSRDRKWRLLVGTSKGSTSPQGRPNKLTIWIQVRQVFFSSWAHATLLAIPIGFALNYSGYTAASNFAVNFVAIVPSILSLTFIVDELILRVGETLGGLLDATFR